MLISESLQNTILKLEKKTCEKSLLEFILSFWHIVSEETLLLNWHIEYLCQQLEEITKYIIERKPKPYDVCINIPPGTTKSTIVTVMWPVWLWVIDSSIRIISNSHSSQLSLEHATKSKDIIESPKFKKLWPDIEIRSDKSAKGLYENTHTGARQVTSTGSTSTGFHAHVIIHDDPSDPKEEFSEALAHQVVEKIKELSTRKIDKRNTITVTIMQRLHQDDATGYLLKTDPNIHHICIPAELSDKVKPPELKEKYIDGLLDPIRQSRLVLDVAKRELGSIKYAGQYEQSPTAKEGNVVKREWFKYCSFLHFESIRARNPFNFWIDSAFTDKTKNDPSGILITCMVGFYLYVFKCAKLYKKFPDLVKYIPGFVMANHYTPESLIQIEPKANGISIVHQLQADTILNVKEIKSELLKDDKYSRLSAKSVVIEAGRVILIEDSWNEEFVDEICGFPNKTHDEYVDLISYAIDYHFPNNLRGIPNESVKKLESWL